MRKRLMSVDPQTLKASVDATFELVEGEVRIVYVSDAAQWSWETYLAELVHPEGRLVGPAEGSVYWELLDRTFRQSTFVYVDIEPATGEDL